MDVVHRLVANVWIRVALAISIGLSGFPFGLYDRFEFTDEIIHFCASFVLAPVVAVFVAPETFARASKPRLVVLLVTTWLGAMAVWEVWEWIAVHHLGMDLLIGYQDAMTDLVIDAIAAALAITIARREGAPREVDPSGHP